MSIPDVPAGDELPQKASALLDAVVAISTDLDLPAVLTRIIAAATRLTNAKYGALGVIGPDGSLVEFITQGIDARARDLIGTPPTGKGILGLLLDDPTPLRLQDLGTHPQSAGFPPHHPPMRRFLGTPIVVRGIVFGNLYLTEKVGGGSFSAQDEALVAGLASAAGMVIENARAYGLSERRRQWLEASAQLAETLQPPIRESVALRQIVHRARAVTGALCTFIVELPRGDDATISALDGWDAELIEPALAELATIIEPHDSPATFVIAEKDAILIPLRSHLGASRVFAAVFDHPIRSLSLEDRDQLEGFVYQAGLLLDRAMTVNDREELVRVAERERIGRQLHDVVIQRLFATGMRLESLRYVATTPEAGDQIDRVQEDLDLTVKEIRSTIFGPGSSVT